MWRRLAGPQGAVDLGQDPGPVAFAVPGDAEHASHGRLEPLAELWGVCGAGRCEARGEALAYRADGTVQREVRVAHGVVHPVLIAGVDLGLDAGPGLLAQEEVRDRRGDPVPEVGLRQLGEAGNGTGMVWLV